MNSLCLPHSPPSPPQMPPSVFEQGGLFSPLAPLHLGMLGEEIPNDPGKMFVGGLSWQVYYITMTILLCPGRPPPRV